MADPLTTALIVGGTQAGLGFAEASAANSASRTRGDRQQAMNNVRAQQQQDRLAEEFAQYEGTLRASNAGRGTQGSASSSALAISALSSALSQRTDIETNRQFGNDAVQSQVDGSFQSPFLTGLGPGIRGAATGFQLGGLFGE